MSPEEQLAFFARREGNMAEVLDRNTDELRRRARLVGGLQNETRYTAQTMKVVAGHVGLDVGLLPPRTIDPLAMGDLLSETLVTPISESLSPALILLVHRLVGFELPPRLIGRYRSEAVQLSGTIQLKIQPPTAEQIPTLVSALCETWCQKYGTLFSEQSKLEALAAFHHHFLVIHPFLDGNGRVARALALQQCLDLFGRADMSRFDRGAEYIAALLAADEGYLDPLQEIFRRVVES